MPLLALSCRPVLAWVLPASLFHWSKAYSVWFGVKYKTAPGAPGPHFLIKKHIILENLDDQSTGEQ